MRLRAITAVILGAGLVLACGSKSADDPLPQGGVTAGTSAPAAAKGPRPEDFKLAVRITDKQCFGNAGCNVTYKVVPDYNGPALGEGAWEVTFRVKGPEAGAEIGSFTVSACPDDAAKMCGDLPDESFTGTKSQSTALTATVTEVNPL